MSSPLRNKFGQALYKDRMSYERDLSARLSRIDKEKNRSSLMFDSASQVFINNAKDRREKWNEYDHKYRKYFKTICYATQVNKLEKLQKVLDSNKLNVMNDDLQYKYILLQRELQLLDIEKLKNKPQVLRIENTNSNELKLPYIKQVPTHVYSNPNAEKIENDFSSLYNRYSESDLSFLHSFPSKSELMYTQTGKKFLEAEQQKFYNIKNQGEHYDHIQKNAASDDRFCDLWNSLDYNNN